MPVPAAIETDSAPVTASSSLAGMMVPGRVDDIASIPRILAEPNTRFFLAHHPGEWEVEHVKGTVLGVTFDGPLWLPMLSKRELQPGAALIRTKKAHEPPEETYRHARQLSEAGGWVWLDPVAKLPAECIPPGVVDGGYWREALCQHPQTGQRGTRHLEVWDVPVATLPGRPQSFVQDRARYNLWRASLVLSGQVSPPTDEVMGAMRDRMAGRVERAQTLPLPPNALAPKLAEAEGLAKRYADAVVPAKPVGKAAK